MSERRKRLRRAPTPDSLLALADWFEAKRPRVKLFVGEDREHTAAHLLRRLADELHKASRDTPDSERAA